MPMVMREITRTECPTCHHPPRFSMDAYRKKSKKSLPAGTDSDIVGPADDPELAGMCLRELRNMVEPLHVSGCTVEGVSFNYEHRETSCSKCGMKFVSLERFVRR